jgi:uncharacterized protein YlxW (UPF0749 family)
LFLEGPFTPAYEALRARRRPLALLHDVRRQLPIAIACIVLGVLLVMQFRTQKANPKPDITGGMVTTMKYLETERNKLMADLKDSRDKLHEYEQAALTDNNQKAMKLIMGELQSARMQAGLIPVHGPGVVVTLDDSPKHPGPSEDAYFFIIHDVDIQAVVNELWAAGAEAVAVNDQRVVTSTSVRCVGPSILVNTTRLTPPYMIRAIGPSKNLETALNMPGGVRASLEASISKGVRLEIEKKADIELPEYKGGGAFRYAESVSAR